MQFLFLLGVLHFGLSGAQGEFPDDSRCQSSDIVITTKDCVTTGWKYHKINGECLRACFGEGDFKTEEDCDRTCRRSVVCTAPRPTPGCTPGSLVDVYYYDPKTKQCLYDRSCTNQGNNFATYRECKETCKADAGPPEYCKERLDQGYTCSTTQQSYRYYYDPNAYQCRWFPHYGCGGGRNNFLTYEICRKHCMAGIPTQR
uniref:BPTI/Kunitz inhibitor domain-containing protein n=1 Tax=Amblyomma maculatum TaxID=34609 RepID=G3MSP0_AMBMU